MDDFNAASASRLRNFIAVDTADPVHLTRNTKRFQPTECFFGPGPTQVAAARTKQAARGTSGAGSEVDTHSLSGLRTLQRPDEAGRERDKRGWQRGRDSLSLGMMRRGDEAR